MQSSMQKRLLWLASAAALVALLPLSTACKQEADDREQAEIEAPVADQGPYLDEGDRLGCEGRPMTGAADAVVTIVEFSDFQCPFCSRVLPTLTQLKEEFPNDVRIFFKQMPLPMHPEARPAHVAALAAAEQGKFWEFHDLAFANGRALNRENFEAWAEQIGLDVDAFKAALDERGEELDAIVQADIDKAAEFGIRGTPNFMVNGVNLRGAQPYERFEEAVRAEITAMRALIDDEGKSLSEAYTARLAANLQAAAAPSQGNNQQRPARPTPDPDDVLFVPVEGSPAKGGDNPLVTIVEFSEFQCPFCSRVGPTVQQILDEYGDQVSIVFKHNPLSFHPRAEPAARAAIAAHNQGKFWEFHDLAFANQRELTDENFVAWAEQLGLNMDQFNADMTAEATTQRIQQDTQLASRVAARGTPHFFVNGVRLRGAQPFDRFKTVIDAQIEAANAAIAGGASRSGIYDHLQREANRGAARMITPPAAAQAPTPQAPAAPPAAVEIPIPDTVPSMGPADAPVTIVEYTDYQCPFCSRFANNVKQAMEQFPGQVRLVVKNFPLGFHQQAPLAAQASLAAHAQGKFWEYHDILWQNTRALHRPNLEQYAEQLGLNMDEFRAALDNSTYEAQVNAEMAEGQGFGVTGTPAWFVNGVRFSGAQPPDQIAQRIQAALDAE